MTLSANVPRSIQRILAIWFPRLAADRLMRQRHGRSWRSRPAGGQGLIFSRRENNTQRVAALDARAEALGLRPGLGVAEARAMRPQVEVAEMDAEADRRLLASLADWCARYTPLVALDGDEGLFLDIAGCAHLFGGEAALLGDALARFEAQGFDARAAIASTPGCAWAAARCRPGAIVAPGAEAGFVAPLPLAALRLEPAVCAGLESVGLRTAGAILGAPRAPLARRFGRSVALRLDQALGAVEEAISPRFPAPALTVERHFPEPIGRQEDVEELIVALSRQARSELERRGEGAERLQLQLFRVDGAVARVTVAASRPLRDPATIQRLFREKLNAAATGLDPGFGFDMARLAVLSTARYDQPQTTLDEAGGDPAGDLAGFVDRLRARLGDKAVAAPRLIESHWPERAAPLIELAAGIPALRSKGAAPPPLTPPRLLRPWGEGDSATESHTRPRPVRLFARPERIEVTAAEIPDGPPGGFRWRNAACRVSRVEGPERIEPEWWRADAKERARDYFRVEDGDGRRYWLFREGRYGGDDPPRWYVQGLFA